MSLSSRILDYAADIIALSVVIFAVELALWAATQWLHLKISIQFGGV